MTFQGKIQNGVVVFDGNPELPEGTPVVVAVASGQTVSRATDTKRMSETEHQRIMAIMDRIASLPDENPGDAFSGKDHDQALYGSYS